MAKRDKPAGAGHNRAGGVDSEHLKAYIERVEKLEEEKADITTDIRAVYAEAKGNGFDVKTIRECVKERRIDAQEREERDALRATYFRALGLVAELEEVI